VFTRYGRMDDTDLPSKEYECDHCGGTCLGSRDGETVEKSPHCPWCGFPQ